MAFAEIALGQIKSLRLTAVPRNYEIWYVYATGSNPALNKIVNEVTLVGSRCGRFEPALDLLASGRVDVAPMISRRMPLSSGADALAAAAEPGVLKVVLTPD